MTDTERSNWYAFQTGWLKGTCGNAADRLDLLCTIFPSGIPVDRLQTVIERLRRAPDEAATEAGQ